MMMMIFANLLLCVSTPLDTDRSADWEQHGFIKGLSCVTQLVLFHHQWTKALDAGNQVAEVFLDFSRALDKVSRVVLPHKFYNFAI